MYILYTFVYLISFCLDFIGKSWDIFKNMGKPHCWLNISASDLCQAMFGMGEETWQRFEPQPNHNRLGRHDVMELDGLAKEDRSAGFSSYSSREQRTSVQHPSILSYHFATSYYHIIYYQSANLLRNCHVTPPKPEVHNTPSPRQRCDQEPLERTSSNQLEASRDLTSFGYPGIKPSKLVKHGSFTMTNCGFMGLNMGISLQILTTHGDFMGLYQLVATEMSPYEATQGKIDMHLTADPQIRPNL